MIDGKQCTICWYVDDNKMSHVDPKVVDQVIRKIEEKFGKMTVTCGKAHNFVVMDLEFRDSGSCAIFIIEYINECFGAYGGEEIGKGANTPGKHDMFHIDSEAKALSKAKMDIFHHIVAEAKRSGFTLINAFKTY